MDSRPARKTTIHQPTDCQIPSSEIPSSAVWLFVSHGMLMSRTALIGPLRRRRSDQVMAIATDERIVGMKKTERKASRPSTLPFRR